MALRIRLSRAGAKKRPFYRIVVADSRSPRDGRYIERLGTNNPMVAKDNESRVILKQERINYWLSQGAKPSDRVARFLGEANMITLPERSEQKNQTLVVLFITLISAFIFYYISSNNIVNSVPFGILLILLLIGFLLWQYKVESQELTEINSSYNYSQILSYVILFFGLLK